MAAEKKTAAEWLELALRLEADGKFSLMEKAFEKACKTEMEENSK